jgi:hypothetical protein
MTEPVDISAAQRSFSNFGTYLCYDLCHYDTVVTIQADISINKMVTLGCIESSRNVMKPTFNRKEQIMR